MRIGIRALTLLAVLSAVYACLRLFTGFSFYDDEGSLILMSRWLLDGHAVYGEFNSVYGPFYFLYERIAHMLAGGSASHTATRMFAVLPWVATCVLAFGYTLRTTRSVAAAMVTWLAVLRTMAFLAAEPGHPQEICVLLLCAVVALSLSHKTSRLAAAGAVVAALALTKINLGVFAGSGLLLAMAGTLPEGRTRRMVLPLIGMLCFVAPAGLMLSLIATPWVWACCSLLAASIFSVVVTLSWVPTETASGWRAWRSLAMGFLLCASLVVGWSLAQGASLTAMLRSTVLANLEQSHTWTVPLPLGIWGPLAGMAGVIAAGFRLSGWRERQFEWLRLAIGVLTLAAVIANRPAIAFALALPFIWMVLLPGESTALGPWPRSVLACVTVMQAMAVYPVAASQLRFTMVLISISAAQITHDAWIALARRSYWNPRVVRRFETAAMVFALGGYLFSAGSAFAHYTRLSPLDLRGTAGIHIDPEDRATYHWIVSRTQKSCDSLVSFPAMPSLYFWTGMMPPVYPDVDGWQAYTNTERQAIERRILSSPRACVVVVDKLMSFWLPNINQSQPTLLGFIRDHFVETDRHLGFHFLERKH